MNKLVNTSILLLILIATPTTQTISIDDFINHEPWTQQEIKNTVLCAAVFAAIYIIYKKLPFTAQDPEFVFEDNHDDDKDETNPKAPVEVDVIVEDDDIDTERNHKTETSTETPGNFMEHPLYSQVADFTW